MTRGTILIDEERCKGCSLCTAVCPQGVITMQETLLNAKGYHPAVLNEATAECTGCGVCAIICPDVCITVYRESRHKPQALSTPVS
jgi:2-oxoglutarate ferredoxin oxidoreductase subunit delta